ncbi:MAG: carbohydrate ABC transporter substrate-binding protein [Clostridia bacterium]|nr:carbohydrate ABC transporter substrate-binding protein [Clostridia bacterium]
MKKFKLGIISMIICVMLSFTACGNKGNGGTTNTQSDKYRITIACQSEESEKDVLEILVDAFEAKYSNYEIEIKTFSGKDFENYMLSMAQNIESSPHIVWTSDSIHARWHRYFTDLRPFYERDASTDYSLYYESMLDTASLNGEFRPTKNYKGSFRADRLDTEHDGTEFDTNHSEYGIYYAPRDYNKPAIVCNTALIEELDTQYEAYMGANLPEGYQSIEERLNSIVAGTNWSELDDLFDFSTLIAERVNYVVDASLSAGDMKINSYWKTKYAIDLKLNWEPTYVTLLNAMGIETMFNADGTINLQNEAAKLEELHGKLYSIDRICNSDGVDTDFATGYTFMKIVSRPVVLGIMNTFKGTYGRAAVQSIQIPVQDIAAGNSGYAINYYYYDQTVTVNGVTKAYQDICWDFIKFVITEEGQQVGGASGSNIPVLKSLRDTGAWRSVADLEGMNHDAWIAGGELKQDWFDIYTSNSRAGFRGAFASFFTNFSKENYGEGSLSALFARLQTDYSALNPTANVR